MFTTYGLKQLKDIRVGDYVHTYNNIFHKVLCVYSTQISDTLYELKLDKNEIIKADSEHRFPVVFKDSNIIKYIKTKDIKIGMSILGTQENFNVISKNIIKNEPVKCILIDSDEHIFSITSNHKKSIKDNLLQTCNTGGGKSVYLYQEISIKE